MCARCEVLQETALRLLGETKALRQEHRHRPTRQQARAVVAENARLERMNRILLERNEILNRRLKEARAVRAAAL